ncbi:UNVERIFIED_CONTAM: hypothetical protein FKN15_012393 [Acipenser sinensis]
MYSRSTLNILADTGAVDVARRSPFACWISAMIYCFGGAVLSGLFLAEPALLPFSNTSNIVLASIIWYLVFYFPMDLVYKFTAFLPLRLVLASMKEVTRTWKVVGGVAHARARYEEGWLVMIAVGWAKAQLDAKAAYCLRQFKIQLVRNKEQLQGECEKLSWFLINKAAIQKQKILVQEKARGHKMVVWSLASS